MDVDNRTVVGVVLAAGAGTRLRPLTALRAKALCPVGNRALVDVALDRVQPFADRVAVNVHHHRDQMTAHLAGRGVHVEVEAERALGTAGALGNLRDWVDGAPVLLTNADAFQQADRARALITPLLTGWDGERPRLLCARTEGPADFGDLRYVGSALLPWWSVRDLRPEPSGLYEVSWAPLHEEGRLDLVVTGEQTIDCGTPADYLRANMVASGGQPVVGEGAVVAGDLVRSVVWPGARVEAGERLIDAVRADGLTLTPYAAEATS